LVIFRKRLAGLSSSVLERFVLRARRLVRMRETVNVILSGSGELRLLNQRFRGMNRPTDVLSFPSMPLRRARPKSAGDVIISVDIARYNARRLGHSPADEVKILALHGILHLAGFDHECDGGEMARKENRLKRQLKLPESLIDRTEGSDRKISVRRTRESSQRGARGRTA
jgi:probable rRNA maturation factor